MCYSGHINMLELYILKIRTIFTVSLHIRIASSQALPYTRIKQVN